MDPTTEQIIASYRGILDQADALIARWFTEAHASPAPPEVAPLSTMLLTLRRAIDTRCKLDLWDNPPKKSPRKVAYDSFNNDLKPFEDHAGDPHGPNPGGDNDIDDARPPESRRNDTTPANPPSPNVGGALLRGDTSSNHFPKSNSTLSRNSNSEHSSERPLSSHPGFSTRLQPTPSPTTLKPPITLDDLANPWRDSNPSSTILSRTAKRPRPISDKESAAMLRKVNSLLDRVDRSLNRSRPPSRSP